PRAHSASPSRSISAIARGVRPSPQVLSLGKVAASATTVSSPARAAHAAALDPAGPAPTTSTSVREGRSVVTTTHSQGWRRASQNGRPAPAPPFPPYPENAYLPREPFSCGVAVSRQ